MSDKKGSDHYLDGWYEVTDIRARLMNTRHFYDSGIGGYLSPEFLDAEKLLVALDKAEKLNRENRDIIAELEGEIQQLENELIEARERE